MIKINAEVITPKSPVILIDQATVDVHLTTTTKSKMDKIKKKNRGAEIHKAKLAKAQNNAERNELKEKITKKNLKGKERVGVEALESWNGR